MESPEPVQMPRFIPPDPELIKIARLFLEKYDSLTGEDKVLYRRLLLNILNPPMIIRDDKIDWESLKVPRL